MRELQGKISVSFPNIISWMHANRLSLSAHKTFYQIYGNTDRIENIHITYGARKLDRAHTVKYLGVLLDEKLKFKSHISKVSGVISRHIGIMSRARYLLNRKLLVMLYNALILPYLNYCSCLCRVGRWWPKWFLPLVLTGKNRLAKTLGGKKWQKVAKSHKD